MTRVYEADWGFAGLALVLVFGIWVRRRRIKARDAAILADLLNGNVEGLGPHGTMSLDHPAVQAVLRRTRETDDGEDVDKLRKQSRPTAAFDDFDDWLADPATDPIAPRGGEGYRQ